MASSKARVNLPQEKNECFQKFKLYNYGEKCDHYWIDNYGASHGRGVNYYFERWSYDFTHLVFYLTSIDASIPFPGPRSNYKYIAVRHNPKLGTRWVRFDHPDVPDEHSRYFDDY